MAHAGFPASREPQNGPGCRSLRCHRRHRALLRVCPGRRGGRQHGPSPVPHPQSGAAGGCARPATARCPRGRRDRGPGYANGWARAPVSAFRRREGAERVVGQGASSTARRVSRKNLEGGQSAETAFTDEEVSTRHPGPNLRPCARSPPRPTSGQSPSPYQKAVGAMTTTQQGRRSAAPRRLDLRLPVAPRLGSIIHPRPTWIPVPGVWCAERRWARACRPGSSPSRPAGGLLLALRRGQTHE